MKRVYILLDKRLSKSQRIPQAAHAVAQLLYEFDPDGQWLRDWLRVDKTLVCLEAEDADLKGKGDAEFYDSDLGFTTAVAFLPMTEEDGDRQFGHLRLA